MPGLIHIFFAWSRLALLGCLIWAGLAAAAQETKPEPPLQAWQYQAVLSALHDPLRLTRLAAIKWLAVNGKPDQPVRVPIGLLNEVATLLEKGDTVTRLAAVEALGRMGPAGDAHADKVAALMNKGNPEIRLAAVEALGRMGPAGGVHADKVVALLENSDRYTRSAAVMALGRMGPAGAVHVDKVAALLANEGWETPAVLEALCLMGSAGAAYADKVAALLENDEWEIQRAAVDALARMGSAGGAHADKVAALLEQGDWETQSAAVEALGRMGPAGAAHADKIAAHVDKVIAMLDKGDSLTWQAAVEALSRMGPAGAAHADKVAAVLKTGGFPTRLEAMKALGRMGPAGAAHADKVAALLEKGDSVAKMLTVEAIGEMGPAGAAHADKVAALLDQDDGKTQSVAIKALGRMGPAVAAHADKLIALFEKGDMDTRQAVVEALPKMGSTTSTPQHLLVRVRCLEAALSGNHDAPQIRFACYFLGHLTPEEQTLLSWLGERQGNDFPQHKALDIDEVLMKMRQLASVWPKLVSFPVTEKSVAEQVYQFAYAHATTFSLSDVPDLTAWVQRLNDAGHTAQAAGVQAVMSRIEFYDRMRLGLLLVVGHLGLWAILIWAYPRWPLVQSLFFWNRWARRFVGLGYVGLLITVVPVLRRRLFMPFRDSLLPQGSLAPFDADTYFPESEVSGKAARSAGGRLGLSAALPEIRGQVVLEGESGLGKTISLLKLARQSKRIVVLLRATECDKGPVAAIQSRLLGVVKDENYLRSLIHAGAIDVLIDGLNEATPNTRAAIIHFVEESFKGNIILTTQPMDWEPPRTAQVLVLHPLRKEQIADFLHRQWTGVKSQSSFTEEPAYLRAVDDYMAHILSWGDDDPRLRVLSNPMEASLVAELIARGEQPDLVSLLAQRFRAMETDFSNQQNRPFPYSRFAEQVYTWRKSGLPYFDPDGFEAEVAALVDHKLMIERAMEMKSQTEIKSVRRWWFRHDKFMEYCLLPSFLGEHAQRRRDHWRDEAFFGVYYLLALRLTDDEDRDLLIFLTEMAADHNRNDLLNRYTLARRARPAMMSKTLSGGGQIYS